MKAVLPNVLSKWISLCLMKREVLCNPNKMTITVFPGFWMVFFSLPLSLPPSCSVWNGKADTDTIHKCIICMKGRCLSQPQPSHSVMIQKVEMLTALTFIFHRVHTEFSKGCKSKIHDLTFWTNASWFNNMPEGTIYSKDMFLIPSPYTF